ncbi:4'-phosphopantetheinyl transferase family protein [Larkinella bovis]|uniref:4'-phosphopantetheinyl transferase family protein n=1 Tax=Larkinella bovis TaxID=683041 RepID=A0ABW0IJ54_9BACT
MEWSLSFEASACMTSQDKEPQLLIASAPLGDGWPEPMARFYQEQVPASLHPRLNAYRNWQDRQRSIIGRLLLAKALQQYGFPDQAGEQIKIGPYGKPYADFGFQFNIAHSASRIVCVASRTVKVGVDIEQIRTIDFSDFESVMSPAQWQQILNSSDSLLAFWRFWTVKEAIAKADGRGLGLPLDTISVESSVAKLEQNRWYVTELHRWDGYCGYVAGSQLIRPDCIRFTDYQFG